MKQTIDVTFKKLSDKIGTDIPSPFYATDGSAGIDLAACLDDLLVIQPNEWKRVPTGLAMQIHDLNVVGLLFPRSGLALRQGVTFQNAVGVIDADYRGPLEILVRNEGTEPLEIRDGDRIAQLVFVPYYRAQIAFSDQLEETARGAGGFGSTGITAARG